MKVHVARYRKADGYETRFWSVTVDGELLAVTVYRRGAQAVANALTTLNRDPHVTTLEDAPQPDTVPHNATAGVAADRTR
jgi:hypothetical protein